MAKPSASPYFRTRSIIDRMIEQDGASVIYQKSALYPALEILVRIREKSREQCGDLEYHILRLVSAGASYQSELSFLTGFPETKLLPILQDMAGRGLLAQDRDTMTRFTPSELGQLTLQHGKEILETNRAILLCGLTGRLLPRELYSAPTIDLSQLKNERFLTELIMENKAITLSHLNLGQMTDKRSVNIPDEATEICGVIAGSATPRYLKCEIVLFAVAGNTKVNLYFSQGQIDWLSVNEVLGLLEPLGYPNSSPDQVITDLTKELKKLGLILDGTGALNENGNPTFTLADAEDKFFSQYISKRLYAAHVGTSQYHARPITGFKRILNGRTVTLSAAPGSSFEQVIDQIRFLDNEIGKLHRKKQTEPEILVQELATKAAEHGLKFNELQQTAVRTKDELFIKAVNGQLRP